MYQHSTCSLFVCSNIITGIYVIASFYRTSSAYLLSEAFGVPNGKALDAFADFFVFLNTTHEQPRAHPLVLPHLV